METGCDMHLDAPVNRTVGLGDMANDGSDGVEAAGE